MSGTKGWGVEELVEKAESLVSTYEHELAVKFYKKALDIEPNNPLILDALGEVLLEIGQPDEAKQFLLRSVEVAPQQGYSKYMNLGQIFQGLDAIKSFNKGVEIMIEHLRNMSGSSSSSTRHVDDDEEDEEEDTEESLKQKICSAYVSMAEIYLTDSCFEENAESECQRLVDEALKYDPESPEALQALASLRISQVRTQDALAALEKSFHLWENSEMKPLISFRLSTAKMFIELTSYENAIKILESLLEEMDEEVEIWYLLGLSHFFLNQALDANDCLTKAIELLDKEVREGKPDDLGMRQQIVDLLKDLPPIPTNETMDAGEEDENVENGDEDDMDED